MQVANNAPGARKTLAGVEHGLHKIVPGSLGGGLNEFMNKRTIFCQQLLDGRGDMFWCDCIKTRQAREIK